jgi:uncharacterized coiled-coil DUF342 family protein
MTRDSDGWPAGGRDTSFLPADTAIQLSKGEAMTKAEEVYTKVEELVAGGKTKADAFKELAKHYQQPVDSLRGSYYTWKSQLEGGGSGSRRPRRRETTPEDALADACRALERAVESVDREVTEARSRADEAKAEHDALKASAPERKKAIQQKLDALK